MKCTSKDCHIEPTFFCEYLTQGAHSSKMTIFNLQFLNPEMGVVRWICAYPLIS